MSDSTRAYALLLEYRRLDPSPVTKVELTTFLAQQGELECHLSLKYIIDGGLKGIGKLRAATEEFCIFEPSQVFHDDLKCDVGLNNNDIPLPWNDYDKDWKINLNFETLS